MEEQTPGCRLPNGNTWLRAEVLSAVCPCTVTFVPDNLACHKIRIANTMLTEMHVLPLLRHHKKTPASVSERQKLLFRFTALHKGEAIHVQKMLMSY